jgi:hypothetical protein
MPHLPWQRDRRRFGGQAAIAACGCASLAGVESLSEAGAERPIVDGAANLQQEIGPSARPTHLLGFVHPAVHQEVGRAFGDRGPDPQSGTVPLGIIDQLVALAAEITIQRMQGRP